MNCTFLHAADIHLDSPLKNLAVHEEAPVDIIRGAARRAFDNLIRLAVEEQVDFLLLAGDLYDGDWKDYNTGLFFIERMRRLRQAGIRVFLVSGNHDAASRITKTLRLPENVTHFSSSRPETMQLEEVGVAIHGRSYPRRVVTENLALSYPEPISHLFNIGLLHTALSGRTGHEPYAPCTRDELVHKGYDYWALGHIHQREEVCREPWIIFPGNLQGRHIRETGTKGATLVRVEDGHVVEVSARELDVIRWSILQMDCREITSEHEFTETANMLLEQELALADGRPLMLRLKLHGQSPFHGALVKDTRYWYNELAALTIDIGDVWLEQIRFHTRPLQTPDTEALSNSPILDLLRSAIDEPSVLLDTPELAALQSKLPPELLREHPLIPEEPEARQDLLEEIRDMVLARLIAGTESQQ